LVGAGWFLGASLGGDLCDMMVLTGEFKTMLEIVDGGICYVKDQIRYRG
jgi:hypothetical protein